MHSNSRQEKTEKDDVIIKAVRSHIELDSCKTHDYDFDRVYLFRTILSKLPVIVVHSNCTRTGFDIKGVMQMLPLNGLLSTPKEVKRENTFYFYFCSDGRAYIDQDFLHFFEKGSEGKHQFSGTWPETLLAVAKKLTESPNTNATQRKIIKALLEI
jgi:hypothetical protein